MQPNRTFCVAIVLSSLSAPALAERFVVLNGQRLSEAQIERLETLRCLPIPNGRYWLDWSTGIWGYEGDPRPQGRLNDPCRYPGQFRRPSLSERGKLFAPGELAR